MANMTKTNARAGMATGSKWMKACTHAMTAAEYVDRVARGDLYDATLSFQLDNGFEVRGVLANYITDEATDGWSALIVWERP